MLVLKQILSFLMSPFLSLKGGFSFSKARKEREAGKQRSILVRLRKEESELSMPISVPQEWQEEVALLRSDFHKKFSRFVIWGQQDIYTSYRFIHRACYYTAKSLGIPTVWLEDGRSSNKWLFPGDLVMVRGDFPTRPSPFYSGSVALLSGVFYCFDRTYSHSFIRELDKKQYLLRQEYRNSMLFGLHGPKTVRLSNQTEGAYYNPELNFLCQVYGTDLLPWQFMPPVFAPDSKEVNYVGFRVRNGGHPDRAVYASFAKYLQTAGLRFHPVEMRTNAEHQELIRRSRLAPMLGGSDLEENYPHCRMFKNISYGQLGYSNIPIHQEIYKECHPPVGSIEEMSDYVLGMSKSDYVEMVHEQQKVTQNYTFLQYLANLFKYF